MKKVGVHAGADRLHSAADRGGSAGSRGLPEGAHRELIGKKYRFARPGLEETPWRTKEVTVGDPFGNRLTFYEDMPTPES